jgi:hypothetical protein
LDSFRSGEWEWYNRQFPMNFRQIMAVSVSLSAILSNRIDSAEIDGLLIGKLFGSNFSDGVFWRMNQEYATDAADLIVLSGRSTDSAGPAGVGSEVAGECDGAGDIEAD